MKKKSVNAKYFKVGAPVQWKWMGGTVNGVVKEIFLEPVVKLIKGKSIKRNGSTGNPAYLVESTAGNVALKLQSELMTQKSVIRPRMFD